MKANFPDLIVEQMKTLTRVQNNAGCQIDPLVPSIQTVGTKTKGFIYADNNQPNTAWTIKSDYVGDSTEIVINDASVFERVDMKAILGKLQNLTNCISKSVTIKDDSNRELVLDFKRIGDVKSITLLYKSGYKVDQQQTIMDVIPVEFRPIRSATVFSVSGAGDVNSNYKFKLVHDGTLIVFSDGTNLSNNMEYTHTYF